MGAAVHLYTFLPISRVRSGTHVTTPVPETLVIRRFPQELQLESAWWT